MSDGTVTGPAAIANGSGSFCIDEVAVRAPEAGEVRVKLAAAGICHTDHASLNWPGPLVMGHEGAGHVEAVGEGVTGLAPGQAVLLNWAIPCGACQQCGRGAEAICDRTLETDPARFGVSRAHQGATLWRGAAIQRAFNLGTLSRYSVVRAEAVVPLPEEIPPERACILGCAVMTGIGSAINVAQVQPGESVAVVGCGGVGLNVIQGARLAGASRIIAIDKRQEGLDRARALGATDLLLSTGQSELDPLVEEVRNLTGGVGVDHAFEATGMPALAFLPLRLARNGGNALQVSGAHGPASVPLTDFFWNKRYMTPLYGGCVPSRDFPRLFRWASAGEIELASLITREYRLEDLAEAMDDMLSGRTAKGVVRID